MTLYVETEAGRLQVPDAIQAQGRQAVARYLERRVNLDATAAAQRLAEEEGLDLVSVEGTGKDGRITHGDVKEALASQ